MFLKNILSYSVFFQIVFSSENNNSQFYVVSTSQEPSKLYKRPNRVNLEIDFNNLIGGKLESILQNQFECQKKIITKMESQIETLNNDITVLTDTKCKNMFETNIQTRRQKFGKREKVEQLLHNNYTQIYLESSHHDFQKLIGGVLQNQSTQHNILSEMKSQVETTREEILTLKKHNNQDDNYKKSLETKIDLLISQSNDIKTYIENVNNKLTKLTKMTKLKSCIDVQKSGKTLSGVYTIWPDCSPKSFDVWCDMETRGGGWIYVINRFDGSVNFNLSWNDYKNGFGSLNGESWLGLEHLYLLTGNKPTELLIELVDKDLIKAHAHYKEFSIGDEGEGYPIKIIKGYSGDAGNDFGVHVGAKFSTVDRDQDKRPDRNCAAYWGGGFWFTDCFSCFLTGSSPNKKRLKIIKTHSFRGGVVDLNKVRVMIK